MSTIRVSNHALLRVRRAARAGASTGAARSVFRMMAVWGVVCLPPGRVALAQCPDGTPPPCARPVRIAAAPATAPNTIAVLYFDNLSRDTSDAYLADGLTEEVITRLGQIGRLSVKPRSAVRRFKGTTDDPATVGRALGVANLVTGSVRRAGNRLRVTVELVRAAGTVRLWGEAYDRTDGDVFAIQEDIARQVATAVAGQLAPAERASIASRLTRDPVAYDHLLRGNFYLAQRTPNGVRRSIEEYRAAAQADPRSTAAIAREANAIGVYLSWGWEYPGLSPDSLLALGLAVAQRAVRQDSSSADAWQAWGALSLQAHPRDVTSALPAFRRAVTLDPRSAEAFHILGWALGMTGDDSAAATAYRRALAIEPGRAATLEHLARVATRQRHPREAESLLDSALAADPGYTFGYVERTFARAGLGDTAGARRDAETAVGTSSGIQAWAEAALARAQVAAGDTVGARARLARLVAADTGRTAARAFIVVAAAILALGDTATALTVLERAAHNAESVVWMRRPEYDVLRASPRFQRILAESQAR